jgi:hypothetical protein
MITIKTYPIMTTYIKTLLIILGSAVCFASCQKSELTKYEQPAMVYVYKNSSDPNRDSVTYSFATKSAALMQDTVKVPLRIMGLASDKDRQVNVRVIADSSTAIEGTHYQLLPAIIPANSYTGYVPVLVKRNAALKNAELRLLIEVLESADFKPGVPNTLPVSSRAGGSLKFLVKINDYLTKPANWDTQLIIHFGTFSQVKYGFIIKTTGRSEFLFTGTADPISPQQILYYKLLCKQALADYTAANGTLIDEFQSPVTFPN